MCNCVREINQIEKHTEFIPICPLCGEEMEIRESPGCYIAVHKTIDCLYFSTLDYSTKEELISDFEERKRQHEKVKTTMHMIDRYMEERVIPCKDTETIFGLVKWMKNLEEME